MAHHFLRSNSIIEPSKFLNYAGIKASYRETGLRYRWRAWKSGKVLIKKKITQFLQLQNNYLKQTVIEFPNRNTHIVDNNRLSRDFNRKEGKQDTTKNVIS